MPPDTFATPIAWAGKTPDTEPHPTLGNEAMTAMVGVSTLGGSQVVAADGVVVGVMTEVIADLGKSAGQLAYALVAPKPPAPGQHELQAIPWHVMHFEPALRCFMLDVTAEVFRKAPRSLTQGWVAAPDPRWEAELHRYYGAAGTLGEETPPVAPAVTHDFLPELGLSSPLGQRPDPS